MCRQGAANYGFRWCVLVHVDTCLFACAQACVCVCMLIQRCQAVVFSRHCIRERCCDSGRLSTNVQCMYTILYMPHTLYLCCSSFFLPMYLFIWNGLSSLLLSFDRLSLSTSSAHISFSCSLSLTRTHTCTHTSQWV